MKLLSLFDGSGGFPLAGAMCGIIPVAASEVEPFPIRVTTKRFPNMKHLGDISKINGAEIEPVDVITFGSPCQDLSVAGKRKGLNHSELGDEETTRSGLFMEAIRIIREMKEATNGEYPTFAVWENVPGAYSSNKGEDFRIVLEELEKTACNGANIVPKPPKGKWLNAGEIVGDNYSIAWRTLDAQFWGVPQRRRRIYLVADFRGKRAGKILFEREGLRGNFTQSGTQGQGTAGNAENGTGAADGAECIAFDTYNMVPILTAELGIASRDGGHCYENIAGTLRANAGDNQLSVVYSVDQGGGKSSCNIQEDKTPTLTCTHGGSPAVAYAVENHPADSRVNIDDSGKVQTLTSRMGTGGGNVPLVMEKSAGFKPGQGVKAHGMGYEEECSPTLLSGQGTGVVICLQGNGIDRADTAGCNGKGWKEDTSYTLNTVDRPAVAYSLDSLASNSMKSKNPHSGCRVVDKAKTLDTSTQDPSKNQGGICVVQCISLDRAAYNQGINAQYDIGIDDSGTAHTLVAKGPGAVCCETFHCNTEQEMTPPIKARDYKDPLLVCYGIGNGQADQTGLNKEKVGCLNCMHDQQAVLIETEPHYIVRRLTPLECCRLQGFPDWWCSNLETDNPTESDIEFWREVFETHRTVISGTSKPKTDKQIIKWLKDPYSDSAIYKMWGNGICLQNALYVMQGISEHLSMEGENAKEKV